MPKTAIMNVLEAMRDSVLWCLRPDRGTLVAEGPDARRWLQSVVTCDVASLAVGRAAWGLSLTKQGKILSDLFVLDVGERLMIGVAPGTETSVCEHLDRMLVMEDAEISVAARHRWITLHGTAAPAVARKLAALRPDVAHAEIAWTGLGTGLLVVPAEDSDALLAQLVPECSAQLDSSAYETLRQERALPEFGVDYDSGNTPHDASLEQRAVCWNKGCYVGQEVVCMQDMRGKVRRRLASLEVPGATPLEPGTAVSSADGREVIGQVTSSAPAADGRCALALARLKTSFSAPGTELSISGRRGRVRETP